MSKLKIEEGKNTPMVSWDMDCSEFIISGKSYPENARKFYSPLIDWIKDNDIPEPATFKFHFYYMSSSSLIAVFQLIKNIESLFDQGKDVEVEWVYDDEDEDIEKIGRDFTKLTTIPFKFVKLAE